MKKNCLDVCGLLETKMHFFKVAFIHKLRLQHWKFLTNVGMASNARIVVFWNPSTVIIDFLDCSAQGLNVAIYSLVHQLKFTATFIYGFNTIIARRSLWADLRGWQPNGSWLILGDFNSVLSQGDKHNGEAVSTYEVSDFR